MHFELLPFKSEKSAELKNLENSFVFFTEYCDSYHNELFIAIVFSY